MEPNKLENQIREKLNSREIQPSAKAWDRLDAMLSVSEKKKPKRNFNWLYIAAGIIGFLFVGLVFYNQESTVINATNNSVVDRNTINESEIVEQNFPSSIKKHTEKSSNQFEEVVAEVKPKSELKKQEVRVAKVQNTINNSPKNDAIATKTTPETKIEKTGIVVNPETSLASIEPEKPTIKISTKAKLQIDPKILLSQVDGEIELTFRQKVIKTINKNYDTAKQSLASRNQE